MALVTSYILVTGIRFFVKFVDNVNYFQFWSDVANLDFEKLSSGTPIFNISFQTGDHGDGLSFDGVNGALAHAFYPSAAQLGSDTHYDDAETFTFNVSSGK